MKRSEEREAAFVLIYQNLFSDYSAGEILENNIEADEVITDDFCNNLVTTCLDNIESIDNLISKYLKNYKISRLNYLTRTALRLAVTELIYFADIPVAVTVNEAVNLLKKYSSTDDSAYLNGVLGTLIKEEKIVKN